MKKIFQKFWTPKEAIQRIFLAVRIGFHLEGKVMREECLKRIGVERRAVKIGQGSCCDTVFLNGPSPASFSFIFGLFQTNINTILEQINVKKCPSSIQHQDSNPRPSKRESPPITTRPGLLSNCCDTVASVVASDTRDPHFESSGHRQFLFTVNCV